MELQEPDWSRFTNLLDNGLNTSPLNFNQHPDDHIMNIMIRCAKKTTDISNIMISCPKKTIPRGKTRHYRVFWSKHHEELCKRDALRNTADQTGRDALCNTADQTGSATPFATLLIRLEEQTPFATLLI
ncbi:unnamed protein product [Rodentolepis nana]|uniref:Reverse transcriptase domain-containing protein n=1 Tax=Rodentolepis nana TaxID=102285 RepID=A0A0R3TLE7_RODNA|nr:unnamed protein product [Rodentolepis nana]